MTRPATMLEKVERYLKHRRGLGYQLRIEGGMLKQFAAFADANGHRGPLTTELTVQWAQRPSAGDRLYWARRLEVVRCFAKYLSVSEPDTEIPPRGFFGPAHRRTTPHVYTNAEVADLMAAACLLNPRGGLRSQTYATLIGMLACTGLRISEALRLTRSDADLEHGILKVRETKFRKSRFVPVHPTAVRALQNYASARDRISPSGKCDRFFVSDRGQPMPYSTVRTVFRSLCGGLKIASRNRRQPRLHDLRHTFACRRVERWYDTGTNLEGLVAALSVYLGHAKVSDTYWYLTATPELLARAAARFEAFASGVTEGEVRP